MEPALKPMDMTLKSMMTREPARWLAVAESLTAGRLQAKVGAISGASKFFRGGVTAYALESKVGLLGVDREVAARCDCVSEQVARQMACGVIKLLGADIGVATTGYAEPSVEMGVTVPFAWWAIVEKRADGELVERAGRVELASGDRVGMQEFVASQALGALIDYLSGIVKTER